MINTTIFRHNIANGVLEVELAVEGNTACGAAHRQSTAISLTAEQSAVIIGAVENLRQGLAKMITNADKAALEAQEKQRAEAASEPEEKVGKKVGLSGTAKVNRAMIPDAKE